jgi:hypothetical protein
MVLLVRHIPTWGERCENITVGYGVLLLKSVVEGYERTKGLALSFAVG